MKRTIGVTARGIRIPVIREKDDLKTIITEAIIEAAKANNFVVQDRDIVGITESIVARSQGNYATTDDIAEDLKSKIKSDTVGIVFPILSRNRFGVCLKGIAKAFKKVIVLLSYPRDEVGNALLKNEDIDNLDILPSASLTKSEFIAKFGIPKHQFTGINYVKYYEDLIRDEGADATIIFSNDPKAILKYTKYVIACDIHTRKRTKDILKKAGAFVLGLDDILTSPIQNSGYNEEYGLLGSNKSTENKIKLFPRGCMAFTKEIQDEILRLTGKKVEVMVYGDGAFKDPEGGIWELADPTVSPGYTPGLKSLPNELKLKYLADNDFKDLKGSALTKAVKQRIKQKAANLKGKSESLGTTPRKLTDLLGSLCDLVSGSGDKGTPVIYIQGYFDNYSD